MIGNVPKENVINFVACWFLISLNLFQTSLLILLNGLNFAIGYRYLTLGQSICTEGMAQTRDLLKSSIQCLRFLFFSVFFPRSCCFFLFRVKKKFSVEETRDNCGQFLRCWTSEVQLLTKLMLVELERKFSRRFERELIRRRRCGADKANRTASLWLGHWMQPANPNFSTAWFAEQTCLFSCSTDMRSWGTSRAQNTSLATRGSD